MVYRNKCSEEESRKQPLISPFYTAPHIYTTGIFVLSNKTDDEKAKITDAGEP